MAGWFARVDKAPDGKALFPGRAPTSLRAELERHASYGAFVSNHEDRRGAFVLRPGRWYPPTLDALSLGFLSFYPELFRGKDEPRHLTTGTRTSHTFAKVYAFIRGVGGGLGKREKTRRRNGRGGLARYGKSRVFSERGDKGEQRERGLRSAGEGQLRRE